MQPGVVEGQFLLL